MEREKKEMQLCFGTSITSKEFLDSTIFQDAFSSLYQPIIKHLEGLDVNKMVEQAEQTFDDIQDPAKRVELV